MRDPLEEERRRLEASPALSLSAGALSLGKAGSGLTVMSEAVLSVLALVTELNREFGSSLVIITDDATVALPSLYRKATEPCPRSVVQLKPIEEPSARIKHWSEANFAADSIVCRAQVFFVLVLVYEKILERGDRV